MRRQPIALVLLVLAGSARADVRLPALIADHMVLQRGAAVRLWGWADPGETVAVSLPEQQHQATADGAGNWQVLLKPLAATGKPFDISIRGNNEITLSDVIAGEVWVCSGQSNMAMSLGGVSDVEDILKDVATPQLRLFKVTRNAAAEPTQDVSGQWAHSAPQLARSFSGVGYVFGFELQQALGVPVGLIESSWGGTRAEAWTARELMMAEPGLKAEAERFETWADKEHPDWRGSFPKYLKQAEAYHREWARTVREWRAAQAKAKQDGTKPPPRPRHQRQVGSKNNPSVLYNAMVAPLTRCTIKGAIWYQGEANAGRGMAYRTTLKAMICSWRQNWELGDFPFLVVQLPAIGAQPRAPESRSSWAELRESQWLQQKLLPNVGVTVSYDTDVTGNLHPKEKRPVGHRLALAAQGMVYGMGVPYRNPSFKDMAIEGNKVRITFQDVGGGLTTPGGAALAGFAIAGEDGAFVAATAGISALDTVVVSSNAVPAPKAVRYAWAQNPSAANLFGNSGLPAAPFRTDQPSQ